MCHPTNGEEDPNTLPWNKSRIKIGCGQINEQMGWVCTTPDLPNFTFLDKDTGMCECYTSLADWRDVQINRILE